MDLVMKILLGRIKSNNRNSKRLISGLSLEFGDCQLLLPMLVPPV